MPTIVIPELTESATPMLEIWDRILKCLLPAARPILDDVGYYSERDLQIPAEESDLSEEERQALHPIVRILMEAAMASEKMRDSALASTLAKVAKDPSLFSDKLPAAVQWEIARDYARADEKPGTYCMDIWGNEQTSCSYALERPSPGNIARAAEAAYRHMKTTQSLGRPSNPANYVVAHGLGEIFRSSGRNIVRRREPDRMRNGKVVYAEKGPFHDFLGLIFTPLQLTESKLVPVTIDSVVRIAIKEA